MARHGGGQEAISTRTGGVPLWGVGFAIPAFALVAMARRYGYVAHVPLVLILVELIITLAATEVFTSRFPPGSPRARPRLHLLIQISMIGVIIYTLGWGALLAVGFVFPASNIMSYEGSRYGPWAIAWIGITVIAGETAISLGLVKTLVIGPTEHGLALLAVAGTCAVVGIITYNQRDKEEVERSVAESQQRFRALVQHASDMIIVISPENTISYVSPAIETTLGYSGSESLGMHTRVLVPDEEVERWRGFLERANSNESLRYSEFRLRDRDGFLHWCEGKFTDLRATPGINGWVANIRDITERKLAEAAQRETDAALRETQEVFRHAFDEAGVAMALIDPDGSILRSNEAMARLIGYERSEALVGTNEVDITHPEDRGRTARSLRELREEGLNGFNTEKRYVHAKGHSVWVSITTSMVRDDFGSPMYSICQLEDITQRKAVSDRLAFEAAHDTLTGLVNRSRFIESVTQVLQCCKDPVALLFIDLDHFKVVNDELGHAVGDELLIGAAHRLRSAVRPEDVVARFGGDEFVILCERVTGNEGALQVANRLIETLSRTMSVGGKEISMEASVGIAISNKGDTAETLLRKADAAMYQAKHDGRGRATLFHHDRHGVASSGLTTA